MPPPRKVDLLPEELRQWLHDALKARGFAGFEDLADELNAKLEDEGVALSIGKSALHAYSQEYQDFVQYQREASTWAEGWMQEEGLADEAQRHSVLFQMVTTLAFKFMRDKAGGGDVGAMDLHFIGKLLKDIMASSGLREKLLAEERKRIATEARQQAEAEVADRVDVAVQEAGLSAERADELRRKLLGVR